MFIAHFLPVDPPKIVSSLERNISLRAGDRLELNCRATGLPTPQVTWIRSGRGFKNHTLIVNQVNKKDSGLYLCKAYSPAGEDSMKIFVRVEDGDKPTQATGGEYLVTRMVYLSFTRIIRHYYFSACLFHLSVISSGMFQLSPVMKLISRLTESSVNCQYSLAYIK